MNGSYGVLTGPFWGLQKYGRHLPHVDRKKLRIGHLDRKKHLKTPKGTRKPTL